MDGMPLKKGYGTLYTVAAVAVSVMVTLVASASCNTEADSGTAVLFEGEVSLSEDLALDGTVDITSDTSVEGNGHRIVRGPGMVGPMFIVSEGASLSLAGVTIDGSVLGGAVQSMVVVFGGTLILGEHSILTGNVLAHDGSGGAVFLDGSTACSALSITGGTIEGNTAGLDGGAVAATGDVSINFTSGSIRGNAAGRNGGGVYVESGSLQMSGSAGVSGNRAAEGGGVYVLDSLFEMSGDSFVTDNIAETAGGIRLTSGDGTSELRMSGNVKVSNNESSGIAGGILVGIRSILSLSGECVVSCNISAFDGDGIYVESGAYLNASGAPRVGISVADNGIALGRSAVIAVAGGLESGAKINIASVTSDILDGAVVARAIDGSSYEDTAKCMRYTADLEYAVISTPSGEYVLSYEERYEIIADVPRDPYVFPMAMAEYGQQAAVNVVVYNVGNHAISHLKVSISGDGPSWFVAGALSGQSFGPGGKQSFTLRPADGLSPGTYESTVTVTGTNGTESSFRVSFFVSAYRSALIDDSIGEELYRYNSLVEGYESKDSLEVTIRNAGDRAVNGLRAAIGGRDAGMFVIGPMSERNLPSSADECTFTVTPVRGLSPGTYTASVSVTGDDGAFTIFSVSVTVVKASGPGLVWLAVAIACAAAAAVITSLYRFVLRKPLDVVKTTIGEGIIIVGAKKAHKHRAYVFSIDSGGRSVAVTYRIGGGVWRVPIVSKEKYEIPAREIDGRVTIQARG
ncbi:MAG: hypothetical protein LBS92_04130 [Candidatus Methanoplasma sp.]|jgi:predicted outer membrane repeat protein|nr:hypothetical protein [Candidatus Methanoplasma sp.]